MSTKSSGSKVRYAVVGLGHIAQVSVLPAFKSARNSEIVALVSGDPRKRKALSKKYRVALLRVSPQTNASSRARAPTISQACLKPLPCPRIESVFSYSHQSAVQSVL